MAKHILVTLSLLARLTGLAWSQIPAMPNGSASAQTQQLSNAPFAVTPSVNGPSTPAPGNATPLQQSRDMTADYLEVRTQVLLLKEKLDSVVGRADVLVAIVAAVLALGSLTSLFSWARHEFGTLKRSHETLAEQRAAELHALILAGETAAQRRADEIHRTLLELSKNTIDLLIEVRTLSKGACGGKSKGMESTAGGSNPL